MTRSPDTVYTNPEGNRNTHPLAGNALNNPGAAPPPKQVVATVTPPAYTGGGIDAQKAFTSSRAGVDGSGVNGDARVFGWNTGAGNAIEIIDSPGGEQVYMKHHTGASVFLDQDGTIYLHGTSQKGIAINAQRGDVALSGADVVLDATGTVTIQTPGDLNLQVGGSLNINAGKAVNINTGMWNQVINGAYMSQIVRDKNEMIGSQWRETVAGDTRIQTTGSTQVDTGSFMKVRADGAMLINTKSTLDVRSQGATTFHTQSTLNIGSKGAMSLDTQSTYSVEASGEASFDTPTFRTRAGTIRMTASGTHRLDGSTMQVRGNSTTVSGGTVYMRGNVLGRIQYAGTASGLGGTSRLGTASPASPSIGAPEAPTAPEPAQFAPATQIVDAMTSIRKYPDYPKNAKNMSGEGLSMGLNEAGGGGTGIRGAYGEYGRQNSGSPYQQQYPETGNGIRATGTTMASAPLQSGLPSSLINSGTKLGGGKVTIEQLVNAPFSDPIPYNMQSTIAQAHAVLIQNVLAPLSQRHTFNVTSAYRNGSTNHSTGYTADLQNMDPAALFAIAMDALNSKLPCQQIYLEVSNSGKPLLHLRAFPPGQSGTPDVKTFRDNGHQGQGFTVGLNEKQFMQSFG